jgi:pimeloyl-ACP methyl ester carboxylesterase
MMALCREDEGRHFSMPYLETRDSQIHFEVHGAGFPVVLFAPGFLSSRIERWRTNPARPGVPQDFLDPIAALAARFQVIALDIRNAGQSHGKVGPEDGWHSYTADHLALIDHLGIKHCHVMGACIGVSFAFALDKAQPGLVSAMILQNPIGLSARNRQALDGEFGQWADQVKGKLGIEANQLAAFGQRMFGGDFLFAVTRDDVAATTIPVLLMPGDDLVHPAEISADIAQLAKSVEVVTPWKGAAHKDAALRRVIEFCIAHAPQTTTGDCP